jgi:release factor glutamine methyltransferase
MRPSEVLRQAERYLDRHGIESPRATAEILLRHVLGTDRAGLYARAEPLSGSEARAFGRALGRRCVGAPVQHLTGEQVFRGLRLRVRPGVFIPRPETEVVVDAILDVVDQMERPVVVDVGTGTGAIALAVKGERPDAEVHAVDRSPDSVSVARENAAALGLDIAVHEGDLMGPVSVGLRGRVAVVVSNPPYVGREEFEDLPPEVRADPFEALVGGTEVHQRLAAAARAWLGASGALVMEIGSAQGDEVAGVLRRHGYVGVEILPDLTGRDRVVIGRCGAVP